MNSEGGWHSLGHDLQLAILSLLKQWEDKESMQAAMQTARDLRLLASSLISTIEVRDAFALAHYPRHAAAITSMRLKMYILPLAEHMEPFCMVTWLRSTTTACNRLAAVTRVRVELQWPDDDVDPMEPDVMDSLLASIGRACPNLRCLRIDSIDREDEVLVCAMFAAIGQRLPAIIELQLELTWNDEAVMIEGFDIAGIDWAACLPRGLQKFSSFVQLHPELLQQLARLPSLAEVEVCNLGDEDDTTEVQSSSCAWKVLTVMGCYYPSCKTLGRFTAAMPSLHLYCDEPAFWDLDDASQVEGGSVAKAAAWLSHIRNCPEELSIGWVIHIPDAATTTAGIIAALAPLSGLVLLELYHWPVSEATLDELALALPNVGKLILNSCSMSSGAWLRMLSLTSVTDLRITRSLDGETISLAQIIAFTSAVSRPMALTFAGGCMSKTDQAGWEAYEEEQRRQNIGQPQRVVRITQEELRRNKCNRKQ